MRLTLAIGVDGSVGLPRREADALGLLDGDPVEMQSVSRAFALLRGASSPRPAPFLAGSLRSLSAPEVFHFLSTSLKTGTLLLSFGSQGRDARLPDVPEGLRRKTVSFRDGQVTFASSSQRADRLGAVLWRNGLVPADELARCGRLVRAARPLGQVLVEEGLLDPGQLYGAMGLQVREIVLGAFVDEDGEFVFVEGRADERNAVRLPERTRDLLLEGMRRREEVDRLAAGLPERDAVAVPTSGGAGEPGEKGRRLLESLDGVRTVGSALDESGLGTYEGMHVLDELVRGGWVARTSPRAVPEEEAPVPAVPAGGPFETYARIIRHVFEELSKVQPDAGRRLESFFERLPPARRAVFDGVRIGAEGDIDVDQLLLNVGEGAGRPGPAARARALDALESYVSFALFEVKNCLDPVQASRVLAEVGRMQAGGP